MKAFDAKATDIKVKDFAIGCYGIFKAGKLVTVDDSFAHLIQTATFFYWRENR